VYGRERGLSARRACTLFSVAGATLKTNKVIEAETPRETSTDKISALIERIRGKTRDDDPDDPPSTH